MTGQGKSRTRRRNRDVFFQKWKIPSTPTPAESAICMVSPGGQIGRQAGKFDNPSRFEGFRRNFFSAADYGPVAGETPRSRALRRGFGHAKYRNKSTINSRTNIYDCGEFKSNFRRYQKNARAIRSLRAGSTKLKIQTLEAVRTVVNRSGSIVRMTWIFLFVLVCLAQEIATADEAAALRRGLSMINDTDLKRHLSTLASDALEGREAGSRGGQAALAYLRSELKKIREQTKLPLEQVQEFGREYHNLIVLVPGSDEQLKPRSHRDRGSL